VSGYDPYVVCGECGTSYKRGEKCTNKDCPTSQPDGDKDK
jgi:hypothetical protein